MRAPLERGKGALHFYLLARSPSRRRLRSLGPCEQSIVALAHGATSRPPHVAPRRRPRDLRRLPRLRGRPALRGRLKTHERPHEGPALLAPLPRGRVRRRTVGGAVHGAAPDARVAAVGRRHAARARAARARGGAPRRRVRRRGLGGGLPRPRRRAAQRGAEPPAAPRAPRPRRGLRRAGDVRRRALRQAEAAHRPRFFRPASKKARRTPIRSS